MDWVPIVFVTFKLIVLCTGMFYAIKWHYDQGKKGREKERREVLRASLMVGALFILLLLGLGFVTFDVAKMLGLELTFP